MALRKCGLGNRKMEKKYIFAFILNELLELDNIMIDNQEKLWMIKT